ncbi:MAG: Ig-like domain-containing protein, partial [Gammaproteobacteria bacterium]|nr:Ig-like domain-containing protein [Gammaproteobacteria bacterium]
MRGQIISIWHVCFFFLLATGSVQAANLLVVNDSYGIPASRILTVEAFGVLNNDSLDGLNAGEQGVTTTLITNVSKGSLTCPDNSALQLCADGSFEYTPNPSFNGEDTFQYQAEAATGETAIATVTLSACSGGPTIFSCWQKNSYLNKLSELSYSFFSEGFEGGAWDIVRTPDLGAAITAPSIISKGITWTSNHPNTNGISTVSGAARTGQWGGFDPVHGLATGTTTECDVDVPPISCRPHDGLSGSGTALHGVGGYFSGTIGANIAIVLDGTNQISIGRLPDSGHHFFAVIDTAGFSAFEFRELDGKVGQELFIFADDFTIATTGVLPNDPPVLAMIG